MRCQDPQRNVGIVSGVRSKAAVTAGLRYPKSLGEKSVAFLYKTSWVVYKRSTMITGSTSVRALQPKDPQATFVAATKRPTGCEATIDA